MINFIAKKISETRISKGVTQEELADRAQVNVRTIQRIENGESDPRGKTLRLISEALQIDIAEINVENNYIKSAGNKLIHAFFLLALNLVLISIIGFLTLDTNANGNSVFAAFLLSFFIPFFIIVCTKNISGMERLIKYGIGYIIYFMLIISTQGFPYGFVTGIFPCFLISVSVLYYGKVIVNKL